MNMHVEVAAALPAATPAPAGDLDARAKRVAEQAARHADAVDREGRFPAEAVAALKAERLFGIQVPRSLGGEGPR